MVVIYQSSDTKKQSPAERHPRRTSGTTVMAKNNGSTATNIPTTKQFLDIKPEKKVDDIVASQIAMESKTDETEMETKLNSYIVRFLEQFEKANSKKGGEFSASVNVSDVLSGLARMYERVRTTVEYKGEHLLRRNAIERILNRLMVDYGSTSNIKLNQKKSASLVKELIWAKYLPNNEISNTKVEKVGDAIHKYEKILGGLDNLPENVSQAKARKWVLGIASSEIEDILDPSQRELFVNLMYDWFLEHSTWTDKDVEPHEKRIQIYLAIHRAFPKSDDATMRYYLLLQEMTGWNEADDEDVKKLILNFPKYYDEIESHLNFKTKLNLYRKVIKYSAPFEILRQVIIANKEDTEKLLRDDQKLLEQIQITCDANYRQISNRVNTGIIRSIIYIFITKVFLALLMEVPYEVYRFGDIKYIPLTINIVFPAVMMFLIGLSIKIPGVKNTESISNKIQSIVYKSKSNRSLINLNSGSSGTFAKIFGVFYTLLFLAVFGGISALLFEIGYSLFGVIVFFFFLSLVLLFAYRVRYHAQSLKIEAEKEGILSHLSSYLMLPFLNLGFFLSRGLAQINFFTLLMDILIEAPLKSMIELFEEWIGFIKEKRQEVVEVPE